MNYKKIKTSELDYYIKDGWFKGKIVIRNNLVKVRNVVSNKIISISIDSLCDYILSNEWTLNSIKAGVKK